MKITVEKMFENEIILITIYYLFLKRKKISLPYSHYYGLVFTAEVLNSNPYFLHTQIDQDLNLNADKNFHEWSTFANY